MWRSISKHWPEYGMEGFGLGLFMFSACAFGVLLFHPSSAAAQSISAPALRRLLMGMAMGLTAILNIFSPWGKRSGAHLNPATTLMFFRLGKIDATDAALYAISQFIGGVAGVAIAKVVFGSLLAHPSVNYVATTPGPYGLAAAFAAEAVISFILITVVLVVSNTERWARWTGLFVGALVASYITLEAPISGMSMNPARSFGSALAAGVWSGLWLYFIAPPIGMLLASQVYLKLEGRVLCAKLHHINDYRCIFRCGYAGGDMLSSTKRASLKTWSGAGIPRTGCELLLPADSNFFDINCTAL
jgi:aquaporin Z